MNPELRKRRRHLPHWQLGGSVYFITFRSARGELPENAREQLIVHLLHDHGHRYDVHMEIIMPDHAHALLQPLEKSPGVWYELPEIMKGLKGASSRSINRLLETSGKLWQEEYFDRIVRDAAEYDEKADYMWNNPVKAGLVGDPEDYRFFVFPPERVN